MKLEKFLIKQKYIVIPLFSLPSGHQITEAKINGKKGVFILDTGASNTCIDESKVKKFKIKSKKTDHKATGAGTDEIDIRLSKKNKIKIGKWRSNKLALVIMDLSHINTALNLFDIEIDGIIGSDILHLGKGIIQYDKDLLYLKSID
jgi:predicted aspartyl protease